MVLCQDLVHLSQWPRCSIHLASIQTATTWARCGTIFLQFRAASWQRCCWIVLRYTQKGGALQEGLHFRNRFQTMPCILYRVLQHTAATSHIEKPNTLSGRRVVHERQMRRATYWHNRGSNLVDYTFCVLILPCLYFSGDTRHEIQKGLNPLQCKEFRHKMTPPVLNNDKRLFKLGGVIHFGGPEGDRTLDLTDANRTLSQTELRAQINSSKSGTEETIWNY